MNRVSLDVADASVRAFIQALPIQAEGLELESQGRVLCTVLPPGVLSEPDRAVVLERGRELVRRSRERNRGVPEQVLEQEVCQAVEEVRRRSEE
jgi:hypothetical protein